MKHFRQWLGACLLAGLSLQASALNIVLTNDDGFETANIQALFNALKAAGHDVILSAPYVNQSGTSGQVAFLRPITPTATSSEHGLIGPGAFGIGMTTLAPDQYYVSGSPVAAMLYGVDVLAQEKWGDAPDLVISGPNEGNNLGLATVHSGTVGAAVTALNKGIPAIAVSAENDDPAQAILAAELTVRLITELDKRGRVALPFNTGLNVNLPVLDPALGSEHYRFRFAEVGRASTIGLKFYENLGDSPTARAVGIPADLGLPGVAVELPYTAAGYPEDQDRHSEGNALQAGDVVTLSVIEGTYQADHLKAIAVYTKLRKLVK